MILENFEEIKKNEETLQIEDLYLLEEVEKGIFELRKDLDERLLQK